MKTRIVSLILAVIAITIFTGCGKNKKNPEAVLKKYVALCKSGQTEKANKKYGTSEYTIEQHSIHFSADTQYYLIENAPIGDNAVIACLISYGDVNAPQNGYHIYVKLIKQKDGWRVVNTRPSAYDVIHCRRTKQNLKFFKSSNSKTLIVDFDKEVKPFLF